MNQYIFLPIAIVICSQVPVMAQSTIEVVAGAHYQANLSQDVGISLLERYWNPSLDVGARLNIPITRWINLAPSVLFNNYLFNKYHQNGNQPDTERVFVASSGNSSNVFRGTIELQAIDQSDSFVKPYFEIGGGYVIENMGTIHGRIEYLKYIAYSKDFTPPNNTYFAYTIGAGAMISLPADFALEISVRYFSNTANQSYYLFGLGIGYRLLD